jgi:actin-related protein
VGSLYSIGRSSGFIWEISESVNEIVCVEDGFLDQQHIVSSPFTIKSILNQNKKEFNIHEIRKHWVQREDSVFPYVSLPDGETLSFGNDFQNQCGNLLNTFMNDRKEGGLDMLLTGGLFAFPKFRNEIRSRAEEYVNVNKLYTDYDKGFNQKDFYRYSGFLGASILGSLPGYSDFFVNREDYLELGKSSILNDKDSDLGSIDEEKVKSGENRQKFKIVDKMFQ